VAKAVASLEVSYQALEVQTDSFVYSIGILKRPQTVTRYILGQTDGIKERV